MDRIAELEAENANQRAQIEREHRILTGAINRLEAENNLMRQFIERQARGVPCPDTAASVLKALGDT